MGGAWKERGEVVVDQPGLCIDKLPELVNE